MKNILLIIQIVVAALLIVLILIQTRGTGFARSWSSTGASFTRRGLEKLVFKATFIVVALFILISILQLLI